MTKERAREIAWERADLDYLLRAEQEKIERVYAKRAHKLFVGNCSRRLGKTYWACKKAVEVALGCPLVNPRIVYASATKSDLKRFVIPAFEIILSDCPEELLPTWKASELLYRFPNGAEIHLVGLDKRPDGGRGNHCDLYIFEEAGYILNLDYLYSSVVAPMTITRPGARIVMISTPGRTPGHPFKDFCAKALAAGSYAELTIDENDTLTPEQKREALEECLTDSDRDREYFCKHVIDESYAIVPEWRPEYEQEIVRPPEFEKLHRYVAMDLGTKIDLTAIGYAYFHPHTRTLYIEAEDEMTGPKMTTLGLKNLIAEREKTLWAGLPAPYRRVADNDNPLLLQDLALLHGLHFVPTGKDELKAMVDQVRVMVKNGRIIVSPKCPKTIGCLRYGIWNEARTKFGRHQTYGHYDHLAMLVYLVRNIDLYSDPIDTQEIYREYPEKETPVHEALRKLMDVD